MKCCSGHGLLELNPMLKPAPHLCPTSYLPSSKPKWPHTSEGLKKKKQKKTCICYHYFHLLFSEVRDVRGPQETTSSERWACTRKSHTANQSIRTPVKGDDILTIYQTTYFNNTEYFFSPLPRMTVQPQPVARHVIRQTCAEHDKPACAHAPVWFVLWTAKNSVLADLCDLMRAYYTKRSEIKWKQELCRIAI